MDENNENRMIGYALAQSRDDRTLDIVEAGKEGFVDEPSKLKIIRESIERFISTTDYSKPHMVRSGRDWLAGVVIPDSPGKGGRIRPVKFLVQNICWQLTNPGEISDAVCSLIKRLLDNEEMSAERLDDLAKRVAAVAVRHRKTLGCFPLIIILLGIGICALMKLFV